MKKFLMSLIVLGVSIMAACGSGETTADTQGSSGSSTVITRENTAVSTVPEDTEVNAETTAPVTLSDEEIYNAYLTKLCNKLSNIIVDDTHLDGFSDQEGMLGISEYAISGDVDMLNKMGYLIRDLNGDAISELVIFQVDEPGSDPCTGGRILCAYTVVDGEMELLFDGNSRNRYYLLDDGTVYNECSESTSRLGFGIYQLPAADTVLACVEFYFIDYLDEQTSNCYYNQSGQFDIDNSEPLVDGKEAYDTKQNECVARIQKFELTAFSDFAG